MLKVEKTDVYGFEAAIRGARNPMNSWDKMDSYYDNCEFCFGPNDLDLAKRLVKAGPDHRKFMRMIDVTMDVTAPLYWWKEMDQHRIGQTTNSCSTMHKIHSKPIELSDFSIDDFQGEDDELSIKDYFYNVVADCETLRKKFLETRDRRYWKGLIQLLPESYNQKRTVHLNYEVLRNIYRARKGHKLSEWHTLCGWIAALPYANELIIGED